MAKQCVYLNMLVLLMATLLLSSARAQLGIPVPKGCKLKPELCADVACTQAMQRLSDLCNQKVQIMQLYRQTALKAIQADMAWKNAEVRSYGDA